MFKSEQHVGDRVESLKALLPPLTGYTETGTSRVSQMKAEQVVDIFKKIMEGILNSHTIENGQAQSWVWNPRVLTDARKKSVSTLHSQVVQFELSHYKRNGIWALERYLK